MRVWVVALIVVFTASAHADDSLVASQLRIARDAATHGHCDVVAQIGKQVASSDSTFYASTFVADPALAFCLGAPGVKPPPPAEQPAATAAEATPLVTPPISPGRVSGELLLGGAAGLGGALGGAFLGLAFANCNPGGEFCGLGEFILGGIVGEGIGSSLGVYFVGGLGHQHGSYVAALAGAALGTGAAVGFAMHAHGAGAEGIAGAAFVVLPALSSTVLFNFTRRYDVVPVPTSHGIALAGTF